VSRRSPTTVVAAAVVVWLEALGVAGFAIAEIISLDPDRPSVALTSGAFFLIYAAGLAFAGRGLLRLQTWSRSVIVMAQVFQLAVALSFRGGDTTVVSWVLGVPGLLVLALVLSPPTTEALFGDRDEDGEDTTRREPT
jgi:hypothetical protein